MRLHNHGIATTPAPRAGPFIPIKTSENAPNSMFQASTSQPGSHLASQQDLAAGVPQNGRLPVRVDAADGVRCFRALA
eukprot:5826180-Prymnesium_polylepis.1